MVSSVIRAIQLQARRRPDASALIGPELDISFGRLVIFIETLSQRLRSLGVRRGDKVGICIDNCPEVVVAMLAINDLGAAFVPLSPRDPERRLSRLAERAALSAVFVSKGKRIEGVAHHVDVEGLLASADGGALAAEQAPESRIEQEELAYVIFTSGSTGEPKGVCISQASFFAATQAAAEVMGFDETTRSLAILPMHFDGSFSGVFPVLVRGGCVLIFRGPLCPPVRFSRLMKSFGLTHSTVTPTYLRELMNEVLHGAEPTSWRTLALGGEAPSKGELRQLRAALPSLRFYNRYGPTEATMAVATLEIDDEMLASASPVPLGHPHPGVTFCVDGKPDEVISQGQIGELWIGGTQLMTGYLDDPEGTARVVVQGADRRWLRSGDLVTVDELGRYVFVERADNVVKRNGTRIALAEVEAAVCAMDDVVSAACVKVVVAETVRIFAFVQLAQGEGDDKQFRQELLRELPHTMMPDAIVFLEALPRASATKLDRKALERLGNEMVAKQ